MLETPKTACFTDSNGQKRIGILLLCKECGKEFITRKDQPNTFCNKKCSHKFWSKSHRVDIVCAWCNKVFSKQVSKSTYGSKSGLRFCCRKCKDQAQKLGGLKEIMPPHYGTAKYGYDINGNGIYSKYEAAIYRKLFEEQELVCQRCGYKEFVGSIHIHHMDEQKENNQKFNLVPLCANCHFALHHNRWVLEELNGV